jgi:hypothetical protein
MAKVIEVELRKPDKRSRRLVKKIINACVGEQSDRVVSVLYTVSLQAMQSYAACTEAEAAEFLKDVAEHTILVASQQPSD